MTHPVLKSSKRTFALSTDFATGPLVVSTVVVSTTWGFSEKRLFVFKIRLKRLFCRLFDGSEDDLLSTID